MITLECNYSKKIGLPGFSSHQFSITLRTEIANASQLQLESARLYQLLQTGVDTSIKEIGYLPSPNGNGHSSKTDSDGWACSNKQRDLIIKIVEENKLAKAQVEQLAIERFNKSVKALNKLEASGLIDELLEKLGGRNGNGRGVTPRKVSTR